MFGLSEFFNLDLRQYWIKSALFTSRNLDFSALPRCCVAKTTGWQGCGVGFFVGLRKSNWIIFCITLLSWEFLLIRYSFSWNCCDRKARAAYAQSFAPWQQATIEFTCYDHSPRTLDITFNRSQVKIGRASTPRSLFYCLFAPHICGVVLRAHPVRGESHIQRNANGEVATKLLLKQRILALYHDFHWVLDATKLHSLDVK